MASGQGVHQARCDLSERAPKVATATGRQRRPQRRSVRESKGNALAPKQRASPLSAPFTQTEKSHATWRGVARLLHSAGSTSAARPCFRSVTRISGGASSALLGADCRELGGVRGTPARVVRCVRGEYGVCCLGCRETRLGRAQALAAHGVRVAPGDGTGLALDGRPSSSGSAAAASR